LRRFWVPDKRANAQPQSPCQSAVGIEVAPSFRGARDVWPNTFVREDQADRGGTRFSAEGARGRQKIFGRFDFDKTEFRVSLFFDRPYRFVGDAAGAKPQARNQKEKNRFAKRPTL